MQLLDGPEPLGQVPRQAVDPRDHDDVARLERLPELLPCRAMHGPAGGDVGVEPVIPEAVVVEDAALGGQPAFSLSLGDTDVAEDRWVHSLTPL